MPTQPSHNLITDGINICADYVLRAVKRKSVQMSLYVDRTGGVRVRTTADYGDAHERPAEEFVCAYWRHTVCIEYIREDLAWKLAQMPKYVTQKAAFNIAPSSVNYPSLYSGIATQPVRILAGGTDTHINISTEPKGLGCIVTPIANVRDAADDVAAAALVPPVPVGGRYRTGSIMKIRVT